MPYPFDTNDLLKTMMQNSNQPVEEHTVKVNGIEGARAYSLAPNSDKILVDQNDPIVWFIQTDGAGYKTVSGYDISPHKEVKQEDILKTFDERLTKLEEAMRNGKSYNRSNDQGPKQRSFNSDASDRSNDKG